MVQFTQPVSMQVTQEQYDKDLKESLKILGYFFNSTGQGNYLVTNYGRSNNTIGFTNTVNDFNGYKMEEYNPKLFLALAAMSNEQYGIAGEYWKYIGNYGNQTFTNNKLYKASKLLSEEFAFFNDKNIEDGYHPDNPNCFTKATTKQIIALFNKQQNTMQTEFPKKWAIKLHQEVKQWIEREFNTDAYSSDDAKYYFHFPNYGDYKSDFKVGCHTSSEIKEDYIEITIQQFKDNIVNKPLNKPNMQNSLTRAQLLKLHSDFTCSTFRLAIEEILKTNVMAYDSTLFLISDNAIQRLIKEGTANQKIVITALGIVLKEDKSVNCTRIDDLITTRSEGNFTNISFYLDQKLNWELKKDDENKLCLIPTKK